MPLKTSPVALSLSLSLLLALCLGVVRVITSRSESEYDLLTTVFLPLATLGAVRSIAGQSVLLVRQS